jgi:translation initiation factor 1
MSQKKKMNLSDLGGLVFSTGGPIPQQEQEEISISNQEQSLRVWLEKNHRGGKIATVVKGFVGSEEALSELGRTLKTKCGTGGTAKDGEIIIQGDHREKVVALLADMGFPVKKAGS